MTDREKLIELLAAHCRKSKHCIEEFCELHREHCQSDVADHLIANGVTFAKDTDVPGKWISVDEKLPEDNVQVLACTKHGKAFSAHCKGGKWRVSHSVIITHWMSMPQPPREE